MFGIANCRLKLLSFGIEMVCWAIWVMAPKLSLASAEEMVMMAFFALPMSWYVPAEKKADFPTNRAATLLSIRCRNMTVSLPADRVTPFTQQAAPVWVRVNAPVACLTVPAPRFRSR